MSDESWAPSYASATCRPLGKRPDDKSLVWQHGPLAKPTRLARAALAELDLKLCLGCGEDFSRREVHCALSQWAARKFCSVDCARAAAKARRTGRAVEPRPSRWKRVELDPETKPCAFCGESFERHPGVGA